MNERAMSEVGGGPGAGPSMVLVMSPYKFEELCIAVAKEQGRARVPNTFKVYHDWLVENGMSPAAHMYKTTTIVVDWSLP